MRNKLFTIEIPAFKEVTAEAIRDVLEKELNHKTTVMETTMGEEEDKFPHQLTRYMRDRNDLRSATEPLEKYNKPYRIKEFMGKHAVFTSGKDLIDGNSPEAVHLRAKRWVKKTMKKKEPGLLKVLKEEGKVL